MLDNHHSKHTGFVLNEFSLDLSVIVDFFGFFFLCKRRKSGIKKRILHGNLLVAAIKGITLPIEYHLGWNQIYYY